MTKINYVDNDEFYSELVAYRDACREARRLKHDKPMVPDAIGVKLMKIAVNLSGLREFSSYSYRDELIADAVMIALRYLHNFNPDKSNKPFSYFSILIYRAFLRRIDIERKQAYIKNALYMHNSLHHTVHPDSTPGEPDPLRSRERTYEALDMVSQVQERMQKYEDGLKRKRRNVEKR